MDHNLASKATANTHNSTKEPTDRNVSIINDASVLLGNNLQSLYELKDGKFVPATVQPVLAANGYAHNSATVQPQVLANGQRVIPVAWATIPLVHDVALAPQVWHDRQRLVDDRELLDAMAASNQRHDATSSLEVDQHYLPHLHTPHPQRILGVFPPFDEPHNIPYRSAFGTSIPSTLPQLGAPAPPNGTTQLPFVPVNDTSAVLPDANIDQLASSNALGPALCPTPTFYSLDDDLNRWQMNSAISKTPFGGAPVTPTQANYEFDTWDSCMGFLPQPTGLLDHPLVENGFSPETPSAFENVAVLSAPQPPSLGPQIATPSKVVKPKKRTRASNSQAKDKLIMYQTLTHKHVQAESGEHQGTISVFGAKQQVRSGLDQQAKAEIALAKLRGACPRCRRLKKKCRFDQSPYLPCNSCLEANPTILKAPCTLQATITEMFIFRPGPQADIENHPLNFFKHRKDVLNILGAEMQHTTVQSLEIELTQDMGLALKVMVSPYVPLPRDKTAYEWSTKDGKQEMEMPPYLIGNVEDARAKIIEYAQAARPFYLENLLDSSNSLLWNTFDIALRSRAPMVQMAVSIWSTARFIERTWRICGDETLGMEPVSDKSNPWNGIIPVTPIMDQQLDQIVIRDILRPLKEKLLCQLNGKIHDHQKARENWFEVYLTIFILLNNTEVQLAHNFQFHRRYGFSGRYGPLGKYGDAEAQFHAARTMLAHFHHVCRGHIPLCVNPSGHKLLDNALLDGETVAYLLTMQKDIASKALSLQSLRDKHQYETDLYWCHQMFFRGWEPGPGHIVELSE